MEKGEIFYFQKISIFVKKYLVARVFFVDETTVDRKTSIERRPK